MTGTKEFLNISSFCFSLCFCWELENDKLSPGLLRLQFSPGLDLDWTWFRPGLDSVQSCFRSQLCPYLIPIFVIEILKLVLFFIPRFKPGLGTFEASSLVLAVKSLKTTKATLKQSSFYFKQVKVLYPRSYKLLSIKCLQLSISPSYLYIKINISLPF